VAKRASAIYVVQIRPAAQRDLRKLKKKLSDDQLKRIDGKIRDLGQEPRPAGAEKLSNSDEEYRVRDGDYRILYKIDDSAKTVTVGRIRDRSDVYRKRR
jgi:mRNA interferase RelE/StbE